MHDDLKSDIDCGRGSLSREEPVVRGTPRQVVPALIARDSPQFSDAQMTR